MSYPNLSGAARFVERGDGVRTELPRNLHVFASADIPGYGQEGFMVAAVGANPAEAEILLVEAADAGFQTRTITLERSCPPDQTP